MAKNCYKISKRQWNKWKNHNGLPQAVFNRTMEILLQNYENIMYRGLDIISKREFRVVAHSLAWMAASDIQQLLKEKR